MMLQCPSGVMAFTMLQTGERVELNSGFPIEYTFRTNHGLPWLPSAITVLHLPPEATTALAAEIRRWNA